MRGSGLWLLALLLAVLVGTAVTPWVWRWLYPVPFKEAVTRAAGESGLDPFLIVAVMKVESRFNPKALSSKGARGLMQVMPDTGAWVAERIGLVGFEEEQLYDPEVNLRLGAWYLAHLQRIFDGELVVALAAYNGGQGNVRRWLDSRRWSGGAHTLEDIPFSETRRFVERVLKTYERYHSIYGSDWERAGALVSLTDVR